MVSPSSWNLLPSIPPDQRDFSFATTITGKYLHEVIRTLYRQSGEDSVSFDQFASGLDSRFLVLLGTIFEANIVSHDIAHVEANVEDHLFWEASDQVTARYHEWRRKAGGFTTWIGNTPRSLNKILPYYDSPFSPHPELLAFSVQTSIDIKDEFAPFQRPSYNQRRPMTNEEIRTLLHRELVYLVTEETRSNLYETTLMAIEERYGKKITHRLSNL